MSESVCLFEASPRRGIAHVGIGVFDGVHLGHQAILRSALDSAAAPNEVGIITFEPHPLQIIAPDKAPPRLTSATQKEARLLHLGVTNLLILNFTQQLRSVTPDRFAAQLKRVFPDLKSVSVGTNWRFGFGGAGTPDLLQRLGEKLGYAVHVISPVMIDGLPISSTRIRESVLNRKFDLARQLLGDDFTVSGLVIHGEGRGKTLGFPTANIGDIEQILPPVGVYAVRVNTLNGVYPGVLNIGNRPTFHKSGNISVEAHLINFQGDLYGQKVSLSQWRWIRDEKKFNTPSELVSQIQEDIRNSKS